jgi:hypothetical protein
MKGLTAEQLAIATELYGDGWSFTQVAEAIGASRSTIRRAFLAAGVAIRPRYGWSYDWISP